VQVDATAPSVSWVARAAADGTSVARRGTLTLTVDVRNTGGSTVATVVFRDGTATIAERSRTGRNNELLGRLAIPQQPGRAAQPDDCGDRRGREPDHGPGAS